MNEQEDCLTMQHQSPKPFILIWLLVVINVAILIICSVLYEQKNSASTPYSTNFHIERLSRLGNSGVVVLGTSLVLCGFPYDQAMEALSRKQGISMQFVRFSFLGGEVNDFLPLLKPILAAKPKWVFMQIGPFIVDDANSVNSIEEFSMDTHQFLAWMLLHRQPTSFAVTSFQQTDQGFPESMSIVAHSVQDFGARAFLKNSSLPKAYQQFLTAAKQQGTQVIFLQINRSIDSQRLRSKTSIQAEQQAIQVLSEKYHLPVWQSPAFPLRDYIDGGHLNTKGRAHFTLWFLQRFKHECLGH